MKLKSSIKIHRKTKRNGQKKHKNKSRKNKNIKNKYELKLTEDEFFSIEYPYYNIEVHEGDMLSNFNRLRKYKYKLLYKNPIQRPINKFQNRLVIFEEDYYKNKALYKITDFFSQSCRMRCVYNAREKQSPLQIFKKTKTEIFKLLSKTTRISKASGQKDREISFNDFNEYMFKNYKNCTNFNTTVVISLLKFLKPKKVLDMSSGWGDRLVGSIAYGYNKPEFEYYGTDPSNCMAVNYKKIIKTLVPDKFQANYKVAKTGFENAKLPSNYFDLMFSSPPFFDLEIYENSTDQSIQQFNNLQSWLNNFMYPSIKKINTSLKMGGYMALYMSDYTIDGKKYSYVNEMKDYVRDNIASFNYEGDIHWWDRNNKKVIRKIFVWQKIE